MTSSLVGISQSNDRRQLAICTFAVVYFLVGIWFCWALSLDSDEASTLETTGNSFQYAFNRISNFELQPPLYYVLLWAWRSLDDSLFAARLLSLLSVTVSFPLLIKIWSRIGSKSTGPFVAMFVALNPFLIYAGTEARCYGLLLLLATTFLWLFLTTYVVGVSARRRRSAVVAVAIAGLATHYFMGFLIAAVALSFLLLPYGREDKRRLVFDLTLMAAAIMPALLWIIRQFSLHTSEANIVLSTVDTIRLVGWSSRQLVVPELAGDMDLLRIVAWVAIVGGALTTIFLGRARYSPSQHLMFVSAIVMGLIYAMAAVLLELPLDLRYFTPLMPIVVLCAASLCFGSLPGWSAQAWCVLVAAICIVAAATAYPNNAKPGDWRRVSKLIASQEKPDEAVLIYPAGVETPLIFYYKGSSEVVALPRSPAKLAWSPTKLHLQANAEVENAIEAAAGAPNAVWVVMAGDQKHQPVGAQYLDTYLGENYPRCTSYALYGSWVRYCTRS